MVRKADMLEDLRFVADTIEQVHPDPFVRCGGRITFYQRLRAIGQALPAEMSSAEFAIELGRVTAIIGDGHTAIHARDAEPEETAFPIEFTVIESDLVVTAIHADHAHALGERLASVHDIPVGTLLQSLSDFVGVDNEIALATRLASCLRSPSWVQRLTGSTDLTRSLALKFNSSDTPSLVLSPGRADVDLATPPTMIEKPDFGRATMGWAPMPDAADTIYLRVRVCADYREAYELMAELGTLSTADPFLDRRFGDRANPDGTIDPALILEVPSASAMLGDLCDHAQATGAKRVIVDVRGNPGGQSIISRLLVLAWFGYDAAVRASPAHTLPRISARLQMRWPHQPQLLDGQYDFTELDEVEAALRDGAASNELQFGLNACPSIANQLTTRGRETWWKPASIFVLTDTQTASSGYSIATDLRRVGATLVGTPSSQSGNAFGDYTLHQLPNSGASLGVSFKMFRYWPDDPERGHILRPDIPLTYETFRNHRFDPNTTVTLATQPQDTPAQ